MNTFPKTQDSNQDFFINLSKASAEAMGQILEALNDEVDAAMAQKRIPTLEGAFGKLGLSPSVMM